MGHRTIAFLLASLAALAVPPHAAPWDEDDVVDQELLERWTAEIRPQVAALRGLEFKRPVAVATAGGEEFEDYVKQRLEKSSSEEELAADELVAKLLGMLQPDVVLYDSYMRMVESQVGGFYDPETEGFFLMERFGGDTARIVLAHELTHALDDQHYDIDGTLEGLDGNSDAQFAFHAVVEGSGTAVQNAWIFERMDELDMMDVANSSSMGMDELESAPPFLWKPLVAVYLKGAEFLGRGAGMMAKPVPADLHAAFSDPPRSSEQVLHPEKYWNPERRDDPVEVRLELDALPEGWVVMAEDTMGEFGLGLMVEPPSKRKGVQGQMGFLTARYTYRASQGWGGDRYALLGRDDARLLVLDARWDTEEDARQFLEVLEDQQEHRAAGLAVLANGAPSGQAWEADLPGRRVTLRIWLGVPADEVEELARAVAPR